MRCPKCKKTEYFMQAVVGDEVTCIECGHKAPANRFKYDKVKAKPTHPLINPESSHYTMFDGVEAIERMEQIFSKSELATWAKITSYKYAIRAGHKKSHATMEESILSDINKRLGYEAYYTYLTTDETDKVFEEEGVKLAVSKYYNDREFDIEGYMSYKQCSKDDALNDFIAFVAEGGLTS